MPFRAIEDVEADKGQLVFWRRDPDNQKPVKLRLRAVPASVDRSLRAAFNRGLRVDNLRKQPAARVVERQVETTRDRAAHALLDTENFAILIGDGKAAATYSEVLGFEVKVGEEVVLDGRWTAPVKALVLEAMPRLAAWISDKADELAAQDAEDEEELGKA